MNSTNSVQRIRMIVSYDGTDFFGWQKQPNGPSIQAEIEKVLSKILNTPINTIGSGRTDSGVHALSQNFHFDLSEPLNHPDLLYAVNRLLPRSIRIQKSFFAPKDFHAQISAESKLYRYRILQSKVSCPLRRHYSWWPGKMFDLETLNKMATLLVGEHDFKSFQSTGTPVKTTVRTIYRSEWIRFEDELVFEIEGNGFLKQMVRNIVGAQIDFHEKSDQPTGQLESLLKLRDRQQMGAPAPSRGLCMESVTYPEKLELLCSPLPKKISH